MKTLNDQLSAGLIEFYEHEVVDDRDALRYEEI